MKKYSNTNVLMMLGDHVLWGAYISAVIVFVVGTDQWREDFKPHRDWWEAECGPGTMIEIDGPQNVFVSEDDNGLTFVRRSSEGPAA